MAGIKRFKNKGKVSRVKKTKSFARSHQKTKTSIFPQLVSAILIIAGFLLILYAAGKNFNLSFRLQPSDVKNQVAEDIQLKKIKSINIPKISRNLAVEDGNFENGHWVVSDSGVSYYTNSSLPQQGGNTVLYGHNKAVILGGLVAMNKGDKIELTLNSGDVLVYEVSETKTIKPTDVDILNQTTEPRLTIYTCSGFLDSARFVVIAKKVDDQL